ncbi:MAG: outer membrane lipoprotein chaperone LolA [Gammaproteobacteria bacterium]
MTAGKPTALRFRDGVNGYTGGEAGRGGYSLTVLLMLAGAFLTGTVAGQLLDPQSVAKSHALELRTHLDSWQSIRFGFKQRTYDESEKVIARRQGYLIVNKPRQFYLEMEEPDAETVVSDGKLLWLYDPALSQLQVSTYEEQWQLAPLMLISDRSDRLSEQWEVRAVGSKKRREYHLLPKTEQEFVQQVNLYFERDRLRRLEVYNSLNQRVQLDIVDHELDPELNLELFTFNPPEGTDTIYSPSLAD